MPRSARRPARSDPESSPPTDHESAVPTQGEGQPDAASASEPSAASGYRPEAVALGRAIAVRRTELGRTRKQLAAAAGLSYPYVSGIERGAKSPSAASVRALADALELTPAALWARADTTRPGGSSGPAARRRTDTEADDAALVATIRRVVRDELGGRVARADGPDSSSVDLSGDALAAQVRAHVVEAARALLGNDDIDFDDEGDIPIRRNDVMLFIRVLDDPLSVLVFSPILVGPVETAALLEHLNELNANMHFLRFCFTHGGVVVDIELFADPFVPELVASSCRAISEAAETIGPELQAAFGGRLFFGDEPDDSPRRESGGYL